MKTRHEFVDGHDLVVLTATGTLDLENSKAAMTRLGQSPEFESRYEVLLDFRAVDCEMSVTDLYELASHMAWPHPALPTHRKVAILVNGSRAFDFAKFLEICAINRGLRMRAFVEPEAAHAWLDTEVEAFPAEADRSS